MKKITDFRNLYSLQKTLRFELKPTPITLKKIEEKGFIERDAYRADQYKVVKVLLDRYHRYYIDKSLNGKTLDKQALQDLYVELLLPKFQRNDKNLTKLQTQLRKEIVDFLKEDKATFDNIFKADLLKKILPLWEGDISCEENSAIEAFSKFATYLTGYNTARKNIYSEEAKATAVSYRTIHENLPRFINNMRAYEQIVTSHTDLSLEKFYPEMEPILQGRNLSDIFRIDFFSHLITQRGIDMLNHLIGGWTPNEGAVKIQGLNEYINLYNQKKSKHERAPKLVLLYKQILSDRETLSFVTEEIESDKQLLDWINEFYLLQLCELRIDGNQVDLLSEINNILSLLQISDIERIYIKNDVELTTISQRLYGDYGVIGRALGYYFEHKVDLSWLGKYNKATTESAISKLLKQKEGFTKRGYISISEIQQALDFYITYLDIDHPVRIKHNDRSVVDYFVSHNHPMVDDKSNSNGSIADQIRENYEHIQDLLNIEWDGNRKLQQSKVEVEQIKTFLDSVRELLLFIKPLYISSEETIEVNTLFYGEFRPMYEALNMITPLYNKVRNYLTKKPYSDEKIKLNFDNNGLFLNGFVESKTDNSDNATQYGGYLFRKEVASNFYEYYIGVSADPKLFRQHLADEVMPSDKSEFERFYYYQMKTQSIYGSYIGDHHRSYDDDKARLIKLILNKLTTLGNAELRQSVEMKMKSDTTPTALIRIVEELDSDANRLVFADSEVQNMQNDIIDRLKVVLTDYLGRVPEASRIIENSYTQLEGIISDIEQLSHIKTMVYKPVSQKEMEEVRCRSDKTLYLFKLQTKDLKYLPNKKKIGAKDNLHTMYFKALMSANQSIYDLGKGEIFYRESSIDPIVTHPKNKPTKLKNPLRKGTTSTFTCDLIKDKRYTENKYFFHLSIKCNYSAPERTNINTEVNQYLQQAHPEDINIIGIDRGERNLLYVSLINHKGEIVDKQSFDLNTIVSGHDRFETPYHTLLDEKETERDKARKSWQTIEPIKDLKEGYISQVVHIITNMMIKYNAIVVLEDLNFGFKRSRTKVEKQIYQKFEKMLIDKLNYLVKKDIDPDQPGGLYNALQLTDKFVSFEKIGKQNGFLFYVPAWNTSKIDPTTGFVDLLKPKYENLAQSQSFFSKFKSIRYNETQDYFEFVFDYSDFTTKAEGSITQWAVCSYGKVRYIYNHQTKDADRVDVTKELKELFEKYEIPYSRGQELKENIATSTDVTLHRDITRHLQTLLAMRYSCKNDMEDFILSPVMNSKGLFFKSDKEAINNGLPQDADANGAYHIALKGLWAVDQIRKADNLKNLKLAISNKQWLEFAQTVAAERCHG